jgi:hypothetical protein
MVSQQANNGKLESEATYFVFFFFEQDKGLEGPRGSIISHMAGTNYKEVLWHLLHRETIN